jgi:hypothetical protein
MIIFTIIVKKKEPAGLDRLSCVSEFLSEFFTDGIFDHDFGVGNKSKKRKKSSIGVRTQAWSCVSSLTFQIPFHSSTQRKLKNGAGRKLLMLNYYKLGQ